MTRLWQVSCRRHGGPVSPPPAAVQGMGELVVLLSGWSSLRPWSSPLAHCSVDRMGGQQPLCQVCSEWALPSSCEDEAPLSVSW